MKERIFEQKMDDIYHICKLAMECVVYDNYAFLNEQNALTRVSEEDIKRVIKEYNPKELPIMPPEDYFEKTSYVNEYTDGSGYHIDIFFLYPSGESDLCLQLDIRKKQNKLCFIVNDILVP